MSLLAAVIVGGLIGWGAGLITGRREGIFASIIIGVIGAIIGDYLSRVFGFGAQSFLTLTWSGVLWSLIGSVILLTLLNSIQKSDNYD